MGDCYAGASNAANTDDMVLVTLDAEDCTHSRSLADNNNPTEPMIRTTPESPINA